MKKFERTDKLMCKVDFCYKVFGLCEDENGNKDYGYIKISFDLRKDLSEEMYNELHPKLIKLINPKLIESDDIVLISLDEYIRETED